MKMKQSSLERLNNHYFSIFHRALVRLLAIFSALITLLLSVGLLTYAYVSGKPLSFLRSEPVSPSSIESNDRPNSIGRV